MHRFSEIQEVLMKAVQIKGHVAAGSANVIWGLMAPVAKLVMAAGLVSPLLMGGFRIYGAALLFWLASMFMPDEHVSGKDYFMLAGAALLGIVFNQGCYLFGVSYTSPGEASIITTTMPIWVMLLAAVLLKEPITFLKVAGIVLGALGALILVVGGNGAKADSGDNPMLGDFLVLTAQLSYALYLTFYRNFIRKYSVITLMKWMFTFAAIAITPWIIPEASGTQWNLFGWKEIGGISYVVVFATFLAYICIMTAQKKLRPTLVGMYNYLQPITATCIGICLGLEHFTMFKVLAVILIFAGVSLVTLSKARSSDVA